jgi:hypothetical protein
MGVSVFPVRLMVLKADVELAQSILDSYVAEDENPENEEDPEQPEADDLR